jgi:hypothetical protein
MRHARTDYNRIQDPALEDPTLANGSTPIAEDEPVLLFRAQDVHAPRVAAFYAGLLNDDGNDTMARTVMAQGRQMLLWQTQNRMKAPDMPEGVGIT